MNTSYVDGYHDSGPNVDETASELGLSVGKYTNNPRLGHIHAHGMYENEIHIAFIIGNLSILSICTSSHLTIQVLVVTHPLSS